MHLCIYNIYTYISMYRSINLSTDLDGGQEAEGSLKSPPPGEISDQPPIIVNKARQIL